MKIDIEPLKIEKKKENQVTSSNVFRKGLSKVTDNYKYDEEGIFSRKIFGRVDSCECGALKEPGYCEKCGCRVVDRYGLPHYFIDLGTYVTKYCIDYGQYKDVKDLLDYNAFLCDGEIVEDVDGQYEKYQDREIKIGLDAAREIHPEIDEWAEKHMTDTLFIPHPKDRPNVAMDDGTSFITPVNKAYINVLKNIEYVDNYREVFEYNDVDESNRNYFLLSFYHEIKAAYDECMNQILTDLALGNKSSYVGKDLRGHRVSNAIKGTAINRDDLDEDVILLGDTFIKSLYPSIYSEFGGDMEKINDYLVDHEEVVLLNRPPSICHLSFLAMKPRVASCYKYGTFNDGGLGKNKRSYDEEDNDTLGIRTIAINSIISTPLAGDFDGDTLLVVPLFTQEAKEEAQDMFPSNSYINYEQGNILSEITEDVEYCIFKETGKKDDSDPDLKTTYQVQDLELLYDRDSYIEKYKKAAGDLIFKEDLPTVVDIIDYAVDGKVEKNLQDIFDYFDNEEAFHEYVSRVDTHFLEQEGIEFIDSVVAANVTSITDSGAIYKYLQAIGDDFKLLDEHDCHSEGRLVKLPLTEEEFVFNVKNCHSNVNGEDKVFHSYGEFLEGTKNVEEIYVRSPLTCKHAFDHKCCKKCAGELPSGTKNLGSFATLMITEVATQSALSSMNKGVKNNPNKLLATNGSSVRTEEDYMKWVEPILQDLTGDKVERRYYEIPLLGRVRKVENRDGEEEFRVGSLSMPVSDNLFGMFIYRPRETQYKKMIEKGSFEDTSLKTSIALNSY